MNDVEMKAWSAVADGTPADENARFNALDLMVAAGVSFDSAVAMLRRWATQGGHRIVAVSDGLWRWDFGPNGDGYDNPATL